MSSNPHSADCLLCGDHFSDDLIRRIAREESRAIAHLSEDEVRKRVRVAVKRAIERGARSEAAIRRFVILMFALEPEFDERYRVRQLFSSQAGPFDNVILGMHEWSHPNCWYRSERSHTEERWRNLMSREESHDSPVVAVSGISTDADRLLQLLPEYGFQLDVPYFQTPHHAVRRMLEIAQVGPDDTVLDLGCGNGQIVIMAAALFGARGIGIDLNPEQISTAREIAAQAGVSQRVTFRRADFYDTDFSVASVVTLYLLRDVNLALRENLQRQLPHGARLVSWQFDMGDWQPNIQVSEQGGKIYCWHVDKHGASSQGRSREVGSNLETQLNDRGRSKFSRGCRVRGYARGSGGPGRRRPH